MKEMCDKMKLKFSKTLAIACVLCMAFATLTAFADVTVTTITNYDYTAADTAEMEITTTVAGLEKNGEITYYVENADGIVYIDQATAASNTAEFKFTASKGAVLAATAKNGSDQGYVFPTFEFNDGCNYLTQGTAKVTPTPNNWGVENKTTENVVTTEDGGYIFHGKVSGAAKAYGLTITIDGAPVNLQAMGCDDDGTFAIVVQNISATEAASAVAWAE